MEVIEINGYSTYEKVNIAKQYLVPKQVESNGLTMEIIEIPQDALQEIALKYTREAGVRPRWHVQAL